MTTTQRAAVPAERRGTKEEIKSNTAFRGVGAIIVMLFHFSSYKLATGEVLHIIPFGANIVLTLDLFFVLSGFVVAYIYADGFAAGLTRDAARKFFWQRFVRIYPVHIFALLIFLCERGAFVLIASDNAGLFTGADPTSFFYVDKGIANTPFTLLANVLMIHALGVTSTLSWNYPSWTVSAEFAAYFAFPLMCVLIARAGRYAIPILIGLSMAAYLAIEADWGTVDAPGNIGAIRVIPGFALGVAMCLLARALENVSRARLHVLQTLALAATLFGLTFIDLQALLVAVIALLVLVTAPNRGWLSEAMAWEPLQFLGRVSYSVYMTHAVVGIAVKQAMNLGRPLAGIEEAAAWWPYAVMVVQLAATVVFATIVYRYVEMPARILLSGLVKRRRKSQDVADGALAAQPLSPAPAASVRADQRR